MGQNNMTHKTFFIADLHFGHKNILEFSRGQFKTIEEHDQTLIDNWNSVVRDVDTVWILGDFCFGKKNLEIASKLNGTKKLIMGNHDLLSMKEYIKYFNKIYGCFKLHDCILTHMPIVFGITNDLNRFKYNIHGHSHNETICMKTLPIAKKYKCVSCEQINYTPITYEELFNL
jgi:calcineurin-like phosphoesterase family protein